MVSEIDVQAVNANLAYLLNIPLAHFNELESRMFTALAFNIGITDMDFHDNFEVVNTKCGAQWASDKEKNALLQKIASPPSLDTPETRS